MKTKQKDSLSSDLKRIKEFKKDYADRYYYMLINRRKQGERLLAQNSMRFLLLLLQRSRFMFEALLTCLKTRQRVVAYLAVRAHFEVTGLIAYFYKTLMSYYNGEITYNDIDKILRGLTLGGRTFPDKEKLKERDIPDAVNVLKLIEEADRLFNLMTNEKKNVFRKSYDFLSEFCHPNCLGLAIGGDIISWNTSIFKRKPKFDKNDLETLAVHLDISTIFFFTIYDKCFTAVSEREEKDMPILVRNLPSAMLAISKDRRNYSNLVRAIMQKYRKPKTLVM